MPLFLIFIAQSTTWFVFITAIYIFLHRKGFSKKDFIRIINRFIRKITMQSEKEAKIEIREWQKLKNFVKTLDLPLKDKEDIIWSIERNEKRATETISKNICEETLERIRKSV